MLMSLSRPIIGEVCRAVVEDQRQLSGRLIELVVPRTSLTEDSEICTSHQEITTRS